MNKFRITSKSESQKGDVAIVWAQLANDGLIYDATVVNGVLKSAVVWIKPKNGFTQAHTRDVALAGKTGIAIKTALRNAYIAA